MVAGRIIIEKANISGIMPAELTRKGRKVAPLDLCIRPPRNTLRPYWTGTRRWASVNSHDHEDDPEADDAEQQQAR